MAQAAGPAAALAGVPVGIQGEGVWLGRRQIFVRFAGEAETATLYTAAALAAELGRVSARSKCHSVCVTGKEPLNNANYLCTVFSQWEPTVPVMVVTDGHRPEGIDELGRRVSIIQVAPDLSAGQDAADRAMRALERAAKCGHRHALVLSLRAEVADERVVALVARAHEISGQTMIVVHPPQGEETAHGRRWLVLMERATAQHDDVRFVPRLGAPVGSR
jgi:organic radical activating enzyme